MKCWVKSFWLALALGIGVHGGAKAQTWEQSAAAYERGDYRTSFAGFRVLAEQGYAGAQFNLGLMYTNGRGVPKDDQQAIAWYGKAARQGLDRAQFNLGVMYESGWGATKDDQQAVSWYSKAAEQGLTPAQVALGVMYAKGRGVSKDDQQAVAWYRKAAEQGDSVAQTNLGVMYAKGRGIPKNDQQAVTWFRKAAEQGDADAQTSLGLMYWVGRGILKDEQQAYFWCLLASAQGVQNAVKARDAVEHLLTPKQRAGVQAAARNWQPKTAAKASALAEAVPSGEGGLNPDPSRSVSTGATPPDSTGSGFRVARGAIVTNHHVIDGCSRLRVNGVAVQVRGSDGRSDLALLNATLTGPSTSLRAERAAVGEPVAVAGYPLRGLLSGFNMTTGNLSSLSGMGGDTRLLQISAPVQPGNSGGPVLDSAGNLMGVVVSKLDAIKAAKLTGDIPQNVNFAINANVLRSFLDANSVEYETASSDKALPPTLIAAKAKGFTVLVECWK